MALPIIPEYTPPHAHLAQVSLLITASIDWKDSEKIVSTSSIAENPEQVPQVLADVLFDLDELSQDHLQLIASIAEMMSNASLWLTNHLTDMPHKMHVLLDGDPEIYVQVFTIVKAHRIEEAEA